MRLKKFIPRSLISAYHFALAILGAFRYGFPSRKLQVVGVTGTNGKSSTVEFINAIFEAANYRTALVSSIRVKVGDNSQPNPLGRSMPGRFFLQRFLADAYRDECDIAIIEMTSEGARQHRHRGIALDAFVFLNLAPEHIESHGSLQAYADAKFELAKQLLRSRKRPRVIVANADDVEGVRYLALPVEKSIPFSLAQNSSWSSDERGGRFVFDGTEISVQFPGDFYIKNALAAAELARGFEVRTELIKRGIESVRHIPGRMQRIDAGQDFQVIVDYALTPDALEALYKAFPEKKICVFGSAGGGRDTWKRPVLGEIAEKYCDSVILTNDIAYDEPPQNIVDDIVRGMKKKPEIILDRRLAIRRAFEIAQSAGKNDTVVLITGMGVDTEISAPDGSKEPWSDPDVAMEELTRLSDRKV